MTLEQFEARLQALESSARRWKIAALSLAVLAVASISVGQITLGGGTGGLKAPKVTCDDVVANKSLMLNDSNGKTRLLLAADNDEPFIELKDADGHTLLSLNVTKDAAQILIQDSKGKKLFSAP